MKKEGTIKFRNKTYSYRIWVEDTQIEKMTVHGRLKELNLHLDGKRILYFGDGAVRVFPQTMDEMCVTAYLFRAYYDNPDDPDIPAEILLQETESSGEKYDEMKMLRDTDIFMEEGLALVLSKKEFSSFFERYQKEFEFLEEEQFGKDFLAERALDIFGLNEGISNLSEIRFISSNPDVVPVFQMWEYNPPWLYETAKFLPYKKNTDGNREWVDCSEDGCCVLYAKREVEMDAFDQQEKADRLFEEAVEEFHSLVGNYVDEDFSWEEHVGLFYVKDVETPLTFP